MIKFFIFFFLCYLAHSQDYPYWLKEAIYENNSEIILDDINQLLDKKIDFKNTSYTELKDRLYFIPDSVLNSYKTNKNNLNSLEIDFLEKIDLNYNSLSQSHYILYKPSLNEDTLKNTSANADVFRSTHYLNFRNMDFYFSQLKLKNEKLASHLYAMLQFKFEEENLAIGYMRLKNNNPLVFASPYSQFFYEGSKQSEQNILATAPQRSISKQNQFYGISYSYLNTFNLTFGSQDYNVTASDSSFKSFNFYDTFDKLNANKKTVRELFLLSNYYLNLTNYKLNFSVLFSKLDFPLLINNKLEFIKVDNFLTAALNQQYAFTHGFININTAFQKNAIAFEISARIKETKNILETRYAYYPQAFYNHHSLANSSSKLANNSRLFLLNYSYLIDENFKSFIGLKSEAELFSEKLEDNLNISRTLFYGLEYKNSAHIFKIKSNQNRLLSLSYYYEPIKKTKWHFLWQKNLNTLSSFGLMQYQYQYFRLNISYAIVGETFNVYQNGLEREFLTQFFTFDTFSLDLEYKFITNESLYLMSKFQINSKANFSSGSEKNLDYLLSVACVLNL